MSEQPSKPKTLLLIDPDPATKTLLSEAYDRTDFRIVQHASGQEGLKAIPKLEPSLIISEFSTTDLDGKTIFRRFIRDHSFTRFKHIPFVMFSDTQSRDQHGKELFNLGLRGWFTKPFGAHELRDVLENSFMTHDIVQRDRHLRQEVKRSEYRYRDLLENANDCIFTLDNEGKFVYLNNRFSSMTGWDKDDWLGKPFLSFIDSTDREVAHTHYHMAHQGRARVFETKIVGKSSESIVLSFNITPIFERGTIVGSIGIARDVTEQKKMENEILDLKNFNESIIQSMEAGLLTTDLEGRITSLNAGAERILGWKAESVVGEQIKSVLKPDEVNVLLSGPPPPGTLRYSRETELTDKNGRKRAIGFTAMDRIDNQGKKVGTIVSFRDISELKQMQSQVIRMDRLASLGVLASGIAHEIKNPLAGIKTMAQACEEEFEGEDSRQEYLTRIIRQVNRLDDLLKTFFAFARPKPPDRKYHTLPEILQEVTNLVGKKMSSSGIHYIEQIDKALPAIMVDAQQIQQVLLNLILNSIDAMPDGGELKILANEISSHEARLIRKQTKASKGTDGKYVQIKCMDTGVGIDPDKLEIIFDPFFTTKPNGLGLGLSIVYRIIEEHDGDIHADSNIGQGTTFTVTLPTGE